MGMIWLVKGLERVYLELLGGFRFNLDLDLAF